MLDTMTNDPNIDIYEVVAVEVSVSLVLCKNIM